MYKSFSILRFRGLSKCEINGMQRVTLLTGKNNAGKTTALEAMFVHTGHNNPSLLLVLNALRGVSKVKVDMYNGTDTPWLSAFNSYDDSQPIRLAGEVRVDDKQYVLRSMQLSTVKSVAEMDGLGWHMRSVPYSAEGLTSKILKLETSDAKRSASTAEPIKWSGPSSKASPPKAKIKKPKSNIHYLYYENNQQIIYPQLPMVDSLSRFMSPYHRENAEEYATQFARLQYGGHVPFLVEALKEIEPRLRSLELVFNGEPMLHGDIGLPGRTLLPLAMMGDGVSRITGLVMAIASAKGGGVVLVDDVDTGLHHSVMKSFWATVMKACKMFDVQVVATTHSDDCVRGALRSVQQTSDEKDLSLIRMERNLKDNEVNSFTYDATDIDLALASGLEVR